MMKFVVTAFVLLTLFLSENLALDAENYTTYIEELSHDEKFLDEYTKWSSQLFSQPDYLYGSPHAHFVCPIQKPNSKDSIPTSVHTLRPSDIKCIGAIGDSLTTGLGAHAITPIGLLSENRGISWSIGGDYTYSKIVSLPNILQKYNPKLEGFSTQVSVIFPNDQNATHNRLNVAKSGDHLTDIPSQAELLVDRLKNEKLCDWNKDWKIITIFVGANDLCTFCEDSNITEHTPEQYLTSIRDTLDTLYNASLPRTLVNLVPAPDVRIVKDLNRGGYICQTLHKRICPCAASPTDEQAKVLNDYVQRYQKLAVELINSGRYDKRDDFTVVIQPFLSKIKLPYKNNRTIDYSYFAPDCFHFSGKGHSQAAISLWNNMLEPVGGKQESWNTNQSLICPTKEYPYIFTSKNSAKALDELKVKLTTTSNSITSTTSRIFTTSTTSEETTNTTTVQHHRKHRKDKKDNSDSSFSKMKLLVITGFILIIILILILGIAKRRNARILILQKNTHGFDTLNNAPSMDDFDEEEVWSRPKSQPTYSDTPKTHGTRVSFD